jgi:hypothetical protein
MAARHLVIVLLPRRPVPRPEAYARYRAPDIEDARGGAEEEEHHQKPRLGAEPDIEQPADADADGQRRDQFDSDPEREAKTAHRFLVARLAARGPGIAPVLGCPQAGVEVLQGRRFALVHGKVPAR